MNRSATRYDFGGGEKAIQCEHSLINVEMNYVENTINRRVSVYVFVRNTTELVQCDVASTCNQQPVKDSSTDGS